MFSSVQGPAERYCMLKLFILFSFFRESSEDSDGGYNESGRGYCVFDECKSGAQIYFIDSFPANDTEFRIS